VKEIETMTFEEIGKLVRAKVAEHRAKLTPEERAEEDRRRDERRRRENEEYLAKKDETVPLLEHERDIRDLENLIDYIQGEAADQLDRLADIALDKLQAQEAELKSARNRIDQLLEANLKAQDMKRELAALAAQGDRIEGKVGKTGDDISFLRETNRQNLQRSNDFLAIMPDIEELGVMQRAIRKHLDEKKKSGITNETAARIFKTFYPDPQHTYATLTGHTVGNWLERGEMPKHPHFKISEAALASKMSFLQWLVANCADIGLQIGISEEVNDMLKDL